MLGLTMQLQLESTTEMRKRWCDFETSKWIEEEEEEREVEKEEGEEQTQAQDCL